MNRKRVVATLGGVLLAVVVLTAVLYGANYQDKPNTAQIYAFGGAMLVINLLISILLINKNFKDKQ